MKFHTYFKSADGDKFLDGDRWIDGFFVSFSMHSAYAKYFEMVRHFLLIDREAIGEIVVEHCEPIPDEARSGCAAKYQLNFFDGVNKETKYGAQSSIWASHKEGWQVPPGDVVKALAKVAGCRSNAETGLKLGVTESSVRKVMDGKADVKYAHWRLLMHEAGLFTANCFIKKPGDLYLQEERA